MLLAGLEISESQAIKIDLVIVVMLLFHGQRFSQRL